jgi:hypothetical protein
MYFTGSRGRQVPLRDAERDNYDFFLGLAAMTRTDIVRLDHKRPQLLEHFSSI